MSTTIYNNSSFTDTPYGLELQQTITSSGSVTIPSNIKRVFAVCIGGGGSGAAGYHASTATITNVVASGGTVTYTCNNDFVAGDVVRITGVNPTSFNLNLQKIVTASSTQFTVTNAATGTYVSGGSALAGAPGGGGGAGGFSMGWTYAANTVTVGAGGAAISGVTAPKGGNQGGVSIYGLIIAGGGGGGYASILTGENTTINPTGPGATGAGGYSIAQSSPSISSNPTGYTGMQSLATTANGIFNPAAANQAGVITAGGTINISTIGTDISAPSVGRGLICGGGGGATTTGTATGATGGTGDLYSGGAGSSGTNYTGGAGGGGAGYAGNGGNASGINGGDGGNGGGGGGGSIELGTSGAGGNGVVYLYY